MPPDSVTIRIFRRNRILDGHFVTNKDFNKVERIKIPYYHCLAPNSYNEILEEHGYRSGKISPFGREVVKILQAEYDQEGERCFGKKFL